MKLRINASDKNALNQQDKAIADAYGDSSAPYSGLGNRLCYEITFNDYKKVISASGQVPIPDAKYEISNISLEYEIVTQPALAKHISDEYQNMVLLYDRVLRHRQISVNKPDTIWN